MMSLKSGRFMKLSFELIIKRQIDRVTRVSRLGGQKLKD